MAHPEVDIYVFVVADNKICTVKIQQCLNEFHINIPKWLLFLVYLTFHFVHFIHQTTKNLQYFYQTHLQNVIDEYLCDKLHEHSF